MSWGQKYLVSIGDVQSLNDIGDGGTYMIYAGGCNGETSAHGFLKSITSGTSRVQAQSTAPSVGDDVTVFLFKITKQTNGTYAIQDCIDRYWPAFTSGSANGNWGPTTSTGSTYSFYTKLLNQTDAATVGTTTGKTWTLGCTAGYNSNTNNVYYGVSNPSTAANAQYWSLHGGDAGYMSVTNSPATVAAVPLQFVKVTTYTPKATFTATSPGSLTTGWHQIRWYDTNSDNKTGVATDVEGKFVQNYATNTTVSESNYPLYLKSTKGLSSDDDFVNSLVYISKSAAGTGNATTIRSINGSYVKIDGTATTTSTDASVYTIWFSSTSHPNRTVVCSSNDKNSTSRTSWLPLTSDETSYIGQSTANKYPMTEFSPVTLSDCSLTAWTVSISGISTTDLSGKQVEYTGSDNYGIDKVYDGGTLFFATDKTPTASQFTPDAITGLSSVVSIDATNHTITVNYAPFESTTITDGAFASNTKWYKVKVMRTTTGKYSAWDAYDDICYNSTSNTGATTNSFFCFVKDASVTNGYKIYNYCAGANRSLYNSDTNNEVSKFKESGSTWILKANGTSGYVFQLSGSTSTHLNDVGGQTKMGVWTDSKSATDGGSTLTFEEVSTDEMTTALTLPQAGKFYSFKEVSTSQYLTPVLSTVSGYTTRPAMKASATDAEKPFYYSGFHLCGYYNGKFLGAANNQLIQATDAGTTFAFTKQTDGTYIITFAGSRGLYGAKTGYTDAAGSGTTGTGYYWNITEVSMDNYTVAQQVSDGSSTSLTDATVSVANGSGLLLSGKYYMIKDASVPTGKLFSTTVSNYYLSALKAVKADAGNTITFTYSPLSGITSGFYRVKHCGSGSFINASESALSKNSSQIDEGIYYYDATNSKLQNYKYANYIKEAGVSSTDASAVTFTASPLSCAEYGLNFKIDSKYLNGAGDMSLVDNANSTTDGASYTDFQLIPVTTMDVYTFSITAPEGKTATVSVTTGKGLVVSDDTSTKLYVTSGSEVSANDIQAPIEGYVSTIVVNDDKTITITYKTELKDAQDKAIAAVSGKTFATGVGNYHYTSGETTCYTGFTDAVNACTTTTAVTTLLNSVAINQPAAGFYRFYNSTNNQYVTNVKYGVSGSNENNLQVSSTGTGNETIFYWDGTKLQGYSNGALVDWTCNQSTADTYSKFTIEEASVVGNYAIKANDRINGSSYCYWSTKSDQAFLGAANAKDDANTAFTLSEVEMDEYTVTITTPEGETAPTFGVNAGYGFVANGKYYITSGSDPDKTQMSADITGYTSTFTIDKTAKTITVTYRKTVAVNATTGALSEPMTSGSSYNSRYTSTATANNGEALLNIKVGPTARGNMIFTNGDLCIYYGLSSDCQRYTLTAPTGYIITGYDITWTNIESTTNMSITPKDGETVTAEGTNSATVNVTGLSSQTTYFTLGATGNANKGADLTTFKVYLKMLADTKKQILWDTDADNCYRIPAIAKTKNGTLVAVSDYRPDKQDIGLGSCNLQYRVSTDNGKTWESAGTIVAGDKTNLDWRYGFGDAAIVADCETNKVLVLCATGYRKWPSGNTGTGVGSSSTRENPQHVGRFYGIDNGDGTITWDSSDLTATDDTRDITETIYGLFDDGTDKIQALFFGSGKLCQSHYIKTGTSYRVYGAILGRPNGNRVVYSDDFGSTWKVLGNVNDYPCPNGNEVKVDELPDGRVVLSSRVASGRYYNIFTYSNTETGEGNWGTCVISGSSTNGVLGSSDACNGEILIVPAKKKSDNSNCYLALQSVPTGSSRANVTIFYKELGSNDDLKNVTAFSSNWDGSYQVSTTSSAYSTMVLDANNNIAFFFEETGANSGYDETFLTLNLEVITSDAYEYNSISTTDQATFLKKVYAEQKEELDATEAEKTAIQGKIDAVAITANNSTVDDYYNIVSLLQDKKDVYDKYNVNLGQLGYMSETGYNNFKAAVAAATTRDAVKTAITDNVVIGNYVTPDHAKYYRLKGGYSKNYIIDTNNSSSNATMGTATDATTIFNWDGTYMTSYRTNLRLGKNTRGMSTTADEDVRIALAPSPVLGAFNMISNASSVGTYVYDGSTALDRTLAYVDSHNDWYFVEVTTLPVIKDATSTDAVPVIKGTITSATDVTDNITSAATSVDLTKATVTDDVLASVASSNAISGKNILVYAPSTSESTANNVVVGTTCANLVLDDSYNSFCAPAAFTATNVTYSRDLSNYNWGTICLPYAPIREDGVRYFQFQSASEGVLTLVEVTDALAANTPYVFKQADASTAYTATKTDANTAVLKTEGDMKVTGTWTLNGVLNKTVVCASTEKQTAALEKYPNYTPLIDANAYYITKNQFKQINGYFRLKPFRAYFTVSASARQYTSFSIDEGTATGIDNLLNQGSEVEGYYDISGRKTSDLQKGMNIVRMKNGQSVKVMIK